MPSRGRGPVGGQYALTPAQLAIDPRTGLPRGQEPITDTEVEEAERRGYYAQESQAGRSAAQLTDPYSVYQASRTTPYQGQTSFVRQRYSAVEGRLDQMGREQRAALLRALAEVRIRLARLGVVPIQNLWQQLLVDAINQPTSVSSLVSRYMQLLLQQSAATG